MGTYDCNGVAYSIILIRERYDTNITDSIILIRKRYDTNASYTLYRVINKTRPVSDLLLSSPRAMF